MYKFDGDTVVILKKAYEVRDFKHYAVEAMRAYPEFELDADFIHITHATNILFRHTVYSKKDVTEVFNGLIDFYFGEGNYLAILAVCLAYDTYLAYKNTFLKGWADYLTEEGVQKLKEEIVNDN